MPSYLSAAIEASKTRFPIIGAVAQYVSRASSPSTDPWEIDYSQTVAVTPDPLTGSWLGPGLPLSSSPESTVSLGSHVIESPSSPSHESPVSTKRKRKGKSLAGAFFPSVVAVVEVRDL